MIDLFFKFVIMRLEAAGNRPICNLRKERAPRFRNYCFPLCWRCTSILIGIVFAGLIERPDVPILATLLILPTMIDGGLQQWYKVESTNTRRILTGLMAGVGVGCIVHC